MSHLTNVRRCVYSGLIGLLVGCGGQPGSQADVDDQPFRDAVVRYLQNHNMAMAIKEVKQGPEIAGDTATLTASMTHQQLGGPSVTWQFQFARGPDGTWEVTQHTD